MSPGGLMDTDVCGASVIETITCLITCVTKRRCLTHAEQECVSLYVRRTRLTNMNHSRLYSQTYTSMNTCTHTHTHTNTYTLTQTQVKVYTCNYTVIQSYKQTPTRLPTLCLSLTLSLTDVFSLCLPHTPTHHQHSIHNTPLLRPATVAHTHTHTDTHTHTHTHCPFTHCV